MLLLAKMAAKPLTTVQDCFSTFVQNYQVVVVPKPNQTMNTWLTLTYNKKLNINKHRVPAKRNVFVGTFTLLISLIVRLTGF